VPPPYRWANLARSQLFPPRGTHGSRGPPQLDVLALLGLFRPSRSSVVSPGHGPSSSRPSGPPLSVSWVMPNLLAIEQIPARCEGARPGSRTLSSRRARASRNTFLVVAWLQPLTVGSLQGSRAAQPSVCGPPAPGLSLSSLLQSRRRRLHGGHAGGTLGSWCQSSRRVVPRRPCRRRSWPCLSQSATWRSAPGSPGTSSWSSGRCTCGCRRDRSVERELHAQPAGGTRQRGEPCALHS
jgi:hypothetical protein